MSDWDKREMVKAEVEMLAEKNRATELANESVIQARIDAEQMAAAAEHRACDQTHEQVMARILTVRYCIMITVIVTWGAVLSMVLV